MPALFLHAGVVGTNPETNERYEIEVYATPFYFAWDEDNKRLTFVDFVGARIFDDVIFFQVEREGGVVLKSYMKDKRVA